MTEMGMREHDGAVISEAEKEALLDIIYRYFDTPTAEIGMVLAKTLMYRLTHPRGEAGK